MNPNFRRLLRWTLDALTVLVVITALALLIPERAGVDQEQAFAESVPHLRSLAVDFSKAERTLIVAVQQDCSYCAHSMEFYRRLISLRNERKSSVQVVVAAPPRDAAIADYLESLGVEPDLILNVRPGSLAVQVTPTLLLTDQSGDVLERWEGFLSDGRQASVLSVLYPR